MGREMGGTSIGGGVITTGHDEAWDVSGLGARVNVWHHVALVYDSDTVHFCKMVILSRFVALSVSLTRKVSLFQTSTASARRTRTTTATW